MIKNYIRQPRLTGYFKILEHVRKPSTFRSVKVPLSQLWKAVSSKSKAYIGN